MRKLVRIYSDFIAQHEVVPAFEDLKIPRSVDRSGSGVKRKAYDEAVAAQSRRAIQEPRPSAPDKPCGRAKELVCLSALRSERVRLRVRIEAMLEDLRGRRPRRGDSVNWPFYVSASRESDDLVHELTRLEEIIYRLRLGAPCARRDARYEVDERVDQAVETLDCTGASGGDEGDFDFELFGDGEC